MEQMGNSLDLLVMTKWSAASWQCICSVSSEKRVTSIAFSNDGKHVCFADKFGVVWVVDLHGVDGSQALVNKKASPLLAHYCSIITSLEFSPDGKFVVSADRDFKIHVTVFPKKPLDGAHDIRSFCLGHTEFVSCLAFVCTLDFPQGFLVSGSGDSTVWLWDITSGALLDTFEVGEWWAFTGNLLCYVVTFSCSMKAGHLESDGSDEGYSTVTDLCTIPDSPLVAVAIQSLQGIMLLSCNTSAQTLSIAKVLSIDGENFIPTSLGCSCSAGLLWIVSAVSNLAGFDYSSVPSEGHFWFQEKLS